MSATVIISPSVHQATSEENCPCCAQPNKCVYRSRRPWNCDPAGWGDTTTTKVCTAPDDLPTTGLDTWTKHVGPPECYAEYIHVGGECAVDADCEDYSPPGDPGSLTEEEAAYCCDGGDCPKCFAKNPDLCGGICFPCPGSTTWTAVSSGIVISPPCLVIDGTPGVDEHALVTLCNPNMGWDDTTSSGSLTDCVEAMDDANTDMGDCGHSHDPRVRYPMLYSSGVGFDCSNATVTCNATIMDVTTAADGVTHTYFCGTRTVSTCGATFPMTVVVPDNGDGGIFPFGNCVGATKWGTGGVVTFVINCSDEEAPPLDV